MLFSSSRLPLIVVWRELPTNRWLRSRRYSTLHRCSLLPTSCPKDNFMEAICIPDYGVPGTLWNSIQRETRLILFPSPRALTIMFKQCIYFKFSTGMFTLPTSRVIWVFTMHMEFFGWIWTHVKFWLQKTRKNAIIRIYPLLLYSKSGFISFRGIFIETFSYFNKSMR